MIGYSEDPPRGRRRTFSAVDQPTPKLLGLHRTPNKALHYSSTSSCNEQLSRSISVGARGQDACPSDRETLDGPVEALDSDEEFLGKLFQACLGLYLGAWKLGRRLDSFPGDKLLWIVIKFLGLGPADTDATGSTSATTAGHVGDAPLCPTPAATAQNSGTNKRKRTGNPSNGGKKVRVNVESTKNSSLPPERRWACPFHKHDIDTCLSVFSLARIVDVRQHIHRKHTQPLHCPICGINFKHKLVFRGPFSAQEQHKIS
ncbi:hypothetical protein GQ53DRAFT_876448 [Thozetella sp. PMI_491]|nr:hypothetical protein GQ53DRAFT_876448 [Thozetella sp. PMI_491]